MRRRTRSRRERRLTPWVCALVLAASPLHAQTAADDLARKHFESGAAYLEQSDYDSALREFKAAYDLSKRPELLLNIATVHVRMSQLGPAVEALEAYVAAAPQSEGLETVRVRITNLKKRLADQPAPPSSSPSPPTPPSPSPTPSSSSSSPTSTPTPASHPPPSRLPAYVLFATGGALAAGSLLTGILASNEHSDAKSSCSPTCSDDQLSTGRALAVTSTVLTGAAVVAAGVGALLYFNAAEGEHVASGKPRVAVGAAPGVFAATARWRF